MTKETNAEAELIDSNSSIAFFLSSESYLQTAILTHQAVDAKILKLRFDMPVYYLYSHAIELALKSFLRAKKAEPWGHDLLKLWNECFRHGLTLDPHIHLITGAVIDLLAPYATSYEFRYIQTGFKMLPTLDAVREAAEALQKVIMPTAVATVVGPIPDRG
jgi:hypothetical protein